MFLYEITIDSGVHFLYRDYRMYTCYVVNEMDPLTRCKKCTSSELKHDTIHSRMVIECIIECVIGWMTHWGYESLIHGLDY